MPRQSRIDTPGALHHVICRGINRQKIFTDKDDYLILLKRLIKSGANINVKSPEGETILDLASRSCAR